MEFSPDDPRCSISFITISLFANITMRRRGSCPSSSLGIKAGKRGIQCRNALREADPAGEEASDYFVGLTLVNFHGN